MGGLFKNSYASLTKSMMLCSFLSLSSETDNPLYFRTTTNFVSPTISTSAKPIQHKTHGVINLTQRTKHVQLNFRRLQEIKVNSHNQTLQSDSKPYPSTNNLYPLFFFMALIHTMKDNQTLHAIQDNSTCCFYKTQK